MDTKTYKVDRWLEPSIFGSVNVVALFEDGVVVETRRIHTDSIADAAVASWVECYGAQVAS